MTAVVARLLAPHVRDLGGFSVRRLLPAAEQRSVGPFVFFDHMGPADFAPGHGLDVRPHPHIGLATVTYLYDGAFMHRDSLGTVQRIEPGAVNWMTAGDGIVHSERSPDDLRAAGHRVHGIQTWVALPKARERGDPDFTHVPASALPTLDLPGVRLRVIAGTAFGLEAPTPVASPTLYVAMDLAPGASLALPDEHPERALYVTEGAVRVDATPIPEHHVAVLSRGTTPVLLADTAARVMLFGGAALDGPRRLWWNFVASDEALIDLAKSRWAENRFAPVPGETEFIPLPER
jgi:redox-sensitive bicupin YhaK (pirin superfamily)